MISNNFHQFKPFKMIFLFKINKLESITFTSIILILLIISLHLAKMFIVFVSIAINPKHPTLTLLGINKLNVIERIQPNNKLNNNHNKLFKSH